MGVSPEQVVPEAIRTSVYAFDKCIIGAIGAVTTPLAGAVRYPPLPSGH